MWLDDDGDDEPSTGNIPDPSTRHWRHPSELAAEAAAAAGPILPEGARPGSLTTAHGSGASIFWPITVVGGCIAVAALGMFGLYLTGNAPSEELQVTSATTLDGDGQALSPSSGDSSEPPEALLGPNDDAGSGGIEAGPDRWSGLDSELSPVQPTTTVATSQTSLTSTTVAPPTTTTVVPTTSPAPVGPVVHPRPSGKSPQLAAVVLVDGYLLTSAAAVAGHTNLSIKIGDAWLPAVVVATDPQSDVAVLQVDSAVEGMFPSGPLGQQVKTGIAVYLGYCPSDMAALTPPPSGEPSVEGEAELDEAPTTETVEVLPSGPGCGPVVTEEAPSREADQEPQAADGKDNERPADGESPGGDTFEPKADGAKSKTAPKTLAQADDDREGKVYSLDQTLRTLANHFLYEPIRTGIPQDGQVAGSPLRDAEGRIVGLVVASSSPNVSAVPIDRALEVARSLEEWGVGSPAWLGIEVISTPSGVEVVAVDETGPAADKMQIGDLIDRVNNTVIIEADHLDHLTRTAGPGEELVLRFSRDGKRAKATVEIATVIAAGR